MPSRVSGSYCSPISDNISKRLFEKAKAAKTTTSAGCSNSSPVCSSTYITPVAFWFSSSYKTRRTLARVLNSKLSCLSAVGTTVAKGSDFASKSQPARVQNEQYIHEIGRASCSEKATQMIQEM